MDRRKLAVKQLFKNIGTLKKTAFMQLTHDERVAILESDDSPLHALGNFPFRIEQLRHPIPKAASEPGPLLQGARTKLVPQKYSETEKQTYWKKELNKHADARRRAMEPQPVWPKIGNQPKRGQSKEDWKLEKAAEFEREEQRAAMLQSVKISDYDLWSLEHDGDDKNEFDRETQAAVDRERRQLASRQLKVNIAVNPKTAFMQLTHDERVAILEIDVRDSPLPGLGNFPFWVEQLRHAVPMLETDWEPEYTGRKYSTDEKQAYWANVLNEQAAARRRAIELPTQFWPEPGKQPADNQSYPDWIQEHVAASARKEQMRADFRTIMMSEYDLWSLENDGRDKNEVDRAIEQEKYDAHRALYKMASVPPVPMLGSAGYTGYDKACQYIYRKINSHLPYFCSLAPTTALPDDD